MSYSGFNKRAVIGSFIATFIATIFVIIVLLIFILGSGFVKKISGIKDTTRIDNEIAVGLNDIVVYKTTFALVQYKKIKVTKAGGLKNFRLSQEKNKGGNP